MQIPKKEINGIIFANSRFYRESLTLVLNLDIMKFPLLFIALCITQLSFAQENLQVFIFDITSEAENVRLSNMHKIPLNEGYNNQPSFTSNHTLVLSANNEGQSDILEYNLNTQEKRWINAKTAGGEYSPQQIPLSSDIAAVRLDPNGLQRLYRYDSKTGASTLLIDDLAVAYFSFYNNQKLLATVLNQESMDLTLIDLESKTVDTLWTDAGRALQKIPGTDTMSYTLKNEDGKYDLYGFDIETGDSYYVCELLMDVQDYVWVNDLQILAGLRNRLYLYDTLGFPEWERMASIEEYGIRDITRMAVSPDGKKLAVVGTQLPQE